MLDACSMWVEYGSFGRFGVPTYFKLSNSLQQLLVHPKDPVGTDKVAGTVYKINWYNIGAF